MMGISQINAFTPVYSILPDSESRELGSDKSFMERLETFRKPAYALKGVIRWMEVLSPVSIASYFAEQRKAVRLFTWTFDIPEFYEASSQFSRDLSELHPATTSLTPVAWVKKCIISSLDFSRSGLYFVQTLHITRIIDLTRYSIELPSTLYAITCIFQLAIKSYRMWEAGEKLMTQEIDNNVAIDFARSFLKLFKAALRVSATSFQVSFPIYWLLGLTTLSYALSLCVDTESVRMSK